MCARVVLSNKGKNNFHYPDIGDAMYRILFIRLFFHACSIRNKNLSSYFEPLGNLRKFEKFHANHFVPLLQCRRSKVNTSSEPSAKKMRMEFPKMDSFVSKVPSKQSKLQFQACQKSKCSVKLINLSFPT